MLLAVAVAVGMGGYYFTRPQRLAGVVAGLIEGASPVEARVGAAHLSWGGRVTIEGLRLRVPGQPAGADQLFEADRVLIEPDISELFRGRVVAESIVLVRPTLHLIEDLRTGRFNIQELEPGEEPGEMPRTLPEVFVRDGRIRFGAWDGGRLETVGSVGLRGRLVESSEQPGAYALVLRQTTAGGAGGEGGAGGPVLRGTLRLGGVFEAKAILEHFSIEDPHRNLLPRRLREWWDLLEPRGSLPTVEISYDADPDVGLRATIALEHGALSLPYGDFAPRMTDVSGRFVVRDETIAIEHLTGKVAGIGYTVDGVIHGFEREAAFDLTARTEPFTLAQNPYYLALLPPRVRENYRRFNPSGTFAATAHLRRAQRGGELSYGGELAVIDGWGAYHKFPFPLRHVRGTIDFTRDRVEVDLRGEGLGGGELAITGVVAPPGNGAAVDLRIVATDVPIDDYLLNAMEDKHRKIVDLFLNPGRYRDLVKRGLIRSSDPQLQALAPPGGDDAPLFDMGGTLSAVVEVHRPFGDDMPSDVTLTIDTTGAGMLCEPWPYPLTSAGGTLTIGPHTIVADHIQARGLTGGRGVIDGVVDRPTKRHLVPDIALRDVRLPIDALLLASLPTPQDQWVRRLGLRGVIVGEGRVFENDADDIDFSLKAHLADGSADPFGGGDTGAGDTRLGDVGGWFTVGRSGLVLDQISAHNDDTALSVSGRLDWGEDGPLDANLRLSATGLELGHHLLGLLPADHPARVRLDGLIAAYHPVSRFACELDYRTDAAGGPDDFILTLQPADLAFDWRGRRATFDQITGTAVVRPGRVDFEALSVAFEHGRATLGGRILFDEAVGGGGAPELALRLEARGDGFDPSARALMPDAVVEVIDGLALTGRYDMAATIVSDPARDSLTFDGRIGLENAAADLGIPIRDLRGDLAVTAVTISGDRWPQLDLRLDADQLRAADRLIEPMTLALSTGDRPDTLVIREMIGSVYGGTLVGRGSILLGDPGHYRFDFTLDNASLAPLVDPDGSDATDAPAPGVALSPGAQGGGGKLSASLAIAGVPGRPATRSGRGAMRVYDAALFDRPITMAVLHAANLSLPTNHAFDRASARYLIDGGTVRLEALRFESPSVAIIGAGTLDYPTRQLDLTLVTRNPGAPSLGAIGDMLNVFKDELIAIEVTGTIDDPRAHLVPFRGLRDSWLRLFGPAVRKTPAPVIPVPSGEPVSSRQ